MTRRYAPPLPPPESDPLFAQIIGLPYRERRFLFRRRVLPPYPRFFYRYTTLNPNATDSVDRMRDVIVRSELWLSAPSDFNDPFDTSAHIVIQGTAAERLAMLERMGRRVTNMTEAQKAERRRDLLGDSAALEKATQAAFRRNLDQLGVARFTPLPRNLLMWSHYAASHKGLVFQFEPTQHLDIFTYPIPVQYEKTYPVLNWVHDHERGTGAVMMRKHRVWEYEQEFRIVHPGGARSYLPFAPAGLTGIILGCKATSESTDSIRALLAERQRAGHPPIRLYQAQQHPRDYKLIFRRAISKDQSWPQADRK